MNKEIYCDEEEYISDSKNQTDVPLLFMSGKTKFFPKRIFREYGRGSNHL